MAPAPDGCGRGSLAKLPSLLLGVEAQAGTDALCGSSGTQGSSSDHGKGEAGCKTTVEGRFKESEMRWTVPGVGAIAQHAVAGHVWQEAEPPNTSPPS